MALVLILGRKPEQGDARLMLRIGRAALSKSREQIAQDLGVSLATVRRIEESTVTDEMPHMERIRTYLEAQGVSIRWEQPIQ